MYVDKDSEAYFRVGKLLVKKWAPLLEGIEGEYNIISSAILLENESQHGLDLLTETTVSGVGVSASPNVAQFQHYLLPLVRRVYPNLITNELVGIQPMTSPASLVFYLKYYYRGVVNEAAGTAATKGLTAAGTEYANFVGNTWNIDPYYSLQTVWREPVADGSYLAGPPYVSITQALVVAPTSYISASGSFIAIIANGLPAAATEVRIIKIQGITTAAAPVAVSYAAGTITTVATLLTAAGVADTATYTAQVSAAGSFNTIMTPAGWATTFWRPADWTTALAVGGVLNAVTAAAQYTPVISRLVYDYNMENNRLLPEIDLSVERAAVTARTRKLRTKWSVEASQDLRAMHNIDAEKELVALLANEVAAEIDREILNELIINAAIRVDYDYSNPYVAGGLVAYDDGVGTTSGFPIIGSGNFDDRNRALLYQIIEVSNQIYRQSLRGAGNWIVTCPEIASKLESLREFNADAMSDFTYNLGIQVSGTLQNKFKLYKDPLFPTNLILVGFKGNSFMDAGFFYCPYIPLQITPTVLDPESFNPRKGLLTRYGTVMVENGPRMYAVIKVSNMTARGATPAAALATSTTLSGTTLLDSGSSLV